MKDRRSERVIKKVEPTIRNQEVSSEKLASVQRLLQLERDQHIGMDSKNDSGDLVWSDSDEKKAKKVKVESTKIKRMGTRRPRMTLDLILGDEFDKQGDTFLSVHAGPSIYPPIKLCSVCLDLCKYKCVKCGKLYCSIPCREVHSETNCLKFAD